MDNENGKSKVIAWIINHKLILCAVLGVVLTAIGFSVLFCMDNGYNYISALANIVIATSAVMAYLTARNYLPQLTTQEGYKIAIQMVNNKLQSTSVITDAVVAARKLDVSLNNLDSRRASLIENDNLIKDIKKYEILFDLAKKYERKINSYISTMITYGLKPAPDREVHFKEFRQNLNQINVALFDIKFSINFYHDYHSRMIKISDEKSYTKFHYINEKEEYKKMRNALSSLASAHNTLESNRLSFFGEKKQIGKLFVVNLD